jgi:Cofactor assembly of complex C subunit B
VLLAFSLACTVLIALVDYMFFALSSHATLQHMQMLGLLLSADAEGLSGPMGYSKASYYTSLGLYLLSFPGLWSVIKRAAKTKYKERVYLAPGPAAVAEAKPVKQVRAQCDIITQIHTIVMKFASAVPIKLAVLHTWFA